MAPTATFADMKLFVFVFIQSGWTLAKFAEGERARV
jgi:hypothetical protein